jgi:succinate dehydrogenase / fumarate reductase cytochrome b subunit
LRTPAAMITIRAATRTRGPQVLNPFIPVPVSRRGAPAVWRPRAENPMSRRPGFLSSSVGTKILIAITGLLLFGFLIGHLVGNLQLLAGDGGKAFNIYAYRLERLHYLLYAIELGLIAIFLLHIFKAVSNYLGNQHARPQAYAVKKPAGHTSQKSLASTSMILSGLTVFVFVVLHVRMFKYTPAEMLPTGEGTEMRNVYQLVVDAFQNPWIVGFYVLAVSLLGLHLSHGLASAMQSLGANAPGWTTRAWATGRVIAVVLAAGFAALPLYMFFAF